jgi:hypothetical protein
MGGVTSAHRINEEKIIQKIINLDDLIYRWLTSLSQTGG